MRQAARRRFAGNLAAILVVGFPALAPAQPLIVAGPVDQLGPTAAADDFVLPHDFVITPRSVTFAEGNVAVGRARLDGSPMLPIDPPEFRFHEDRTHGSVFLPTPLLTAREAAFSEVEKTAPALAPVFGDPDLVAAALTRDGSESGTMLVELLQIPLDGGPVQSIEVEVDSDVPFPDPSVHSVDVVQDERDRMTAVFTEVDAGVPVVKAQRVDWDAVALIEDLDIDLGSVDPEIAALDPRGNRLVVVYKDTSSPGMSAPLGTIKSRIVDTTGPTPVVLPEFDVSSTAPIFDLLDPSVAADVNTGEFVVAWTDLTGLGLNPADIRARRFDASGTPLGPDFVVNTTTTGNQDQAQVEFGPGGLWAVTWAGDESATASLDVYLQVFDRDGAPLGSETRANAGLATETDRQDHPVVRWLPFPDSQGRPQVMVAWRDTADPNDNGDGAGPNGSGTTARCFSVDGLPEAQEIFADGFESGDTTSWSRSVP